MHALISDEGTHCIKIMKCVEFQSNLKLYKHYMMVNRVVNEDVPFADFWILLSWHWWMLPEGLISGAGLRPEVWSNGWSCMRPSYLKWLVLLMKSFKTIVTENITFSNRFMVAVKSRIVTVSCLVSANLSSCASSWSFHPVESMQIKN